MSTNPDEFEQKKQKHEDKKSSTPFFESVTAIVLLLLLLILSIYVTFFWGSERKLGDIESWIFLLTALSVIICAFLSLLIHRIGFNLPEMFEKTLGRMEDVAFRRLEKGSPLALVLKLVLLFVPLLTLLYSFIPANDGSGVIPSYYGIILFVSAFYVVLARKHLTSPFRTQYDKLDEALYHNQQLSKRTKCFLKESLSRLVVLLDYLRLDFANVNYTMDLCRNEKYQVRYRLLKSFLDTLREIQHRFMSREGDFVATKVYGIESLQVVQNIMDEIGIRIRQESDKLTDAGWYGDEPEESNPRPRQTQWKQLLYSIQEVQKGFLALHTENPSEEELFKRLFQQLFDEERNKFTGSVVELATKRQDVTIPQFIAPVVMKELINREQVLSICATSETTLEEFHEKYGSFPANMTKQGSERIFLCDVNTVEKEFFKESRRLHSKLREGHVDLIGNGNRETLGLGKLFVKNAPIPMLLWMLEWHMMYRWTAYLAEWKWVLELNRETGNPVNYLDFVIAREEEHDLVFCITKEPNKIVFFEQKIDSYKVDMSLDTGTRDDRKTFKFFRHIKDGSACSPIDRFLASISDREEAKEFAWDTIKHKKATLKEIVEMCSEFPI